MSLFFGKAPETNKEANRTLNRLNSKLNKMIENNPIGNQGNQSLSFSTNQMNELVDTIKSKIQIININEHSKPCTQITKNQTKLLNDDNIEVVIICAQNSLNATKQNSGGAHFPQKFGEMLELGAGFRLFSKMDATPLRKRTKGGFSTSNVRTRIYVRNVIFTNLTNQEKNLKNQEKNLTNQEKIKKVNYLKQSYPKGNQRFPYSPGEIKKTNYRHFKNNKTPKNTKITFENNTKPNNGPNILHIIEFKTSKIYYHNHQGIIKTKLVLKYKQCEYELDIINMGEDIDGNYPSNPLNSSIETCAIDIIKCSPNKRISNNNSLKSLKINNIGKNKNQGSNTQNNTTSNNRTLTNRTPTNKTPLLNNQHRTSTKIPPKGTVSQWDIEQNELTRELNEIEIDNSPIINHNQRSRVNNFTREQILGKNNSVRITNNDLSSINKIMEKKGKNPEQFKEALKEALEKAKAKEKNKNIVKILASKLTEKYQQIQNNTSNSNREKIQKKAKYVYIRLVLKSLDPKLTFIVNRTNRTQNRTSRVPGTSRITSQMNSTSGALQERGNQLTILEERTGELANKAGNFSNIAKKLRIQKEKEAKARQKMINKINPLKWFK